jgi:EAL domain-containing protein (putative c-di-GMP-specific phosphodiesterase class I)/CheY-like chemotaxis protein
MSRILFVDPIPGSQEALLTALGVAGHEVWAVTNGPDALALALAQRFDLVIADDSAAGMENLELLTALRQARPTLRALLLSATLHKALAKRAVNEAGAVGVLAKPVNESATLAAVKRALAIPSPAAPVNWEGFDEEGQMVRECLDSEGFRLALQPVVTARGSVVVGFEALLRTNHPILSTPRLLLVAAERHNMLPELGNAIVGRAAEWLFRLPDRARLFLNLHPEDLRDTDILAGRLEPLLPWASRLTLDLTGECFARWPDLHARVRQLRSLGFSISLDDLGDGPGALSLLAELGPDVMKLDPSLVRNLDQSPRKRRLVEMLCSFGAATDATVLAEGVETQSEARALQDLGVSLLQGYLYGRPSTSLLTAAPLAQSA